MCVISDILAEHIALQIQSKHLSISLNIGTTHLSSFILL